MLPLDRLPVYPLRRAVEGRRRANLAGLAPVAAFYGRLRLIRPRRHVPLKLVAMYYRWRSESAAKGATPGILDGAYPPISTTRFIHSCQACTLGIIRLLPTKPPRGRSRGTHSKRPEPPWITTAARRPSQRRPARRRYRPRPWLPSCCAACDGCRRRRQRSRLPS